MKQYAIGILTLFFLILPFEDIQSQINTFPYVEDFENGDGGWTVQGSSSWELGIPDNVIINTSEFGNSSWVTNLNGTYFSNEFGWIESPSFDLTPLNEPYLKMSLWWDTTTNDGGTIQTSIDSGSSWQTLFDTPGNEPTGSIFNWMNNENISAIGGEAGWDNSSGSWVTVVYPLTNLNGQNNIRFRILFGSDANSEGEGLAFDNFQILNSSCYTYEEEDFLLETDEFDENQYLTCVINGLEGNLTDVLFENSEVPLDENLQYRWDFQSGPFGPRGPKIVKFATDNNADFPNTGNGQDQLFIFKYASEDGTCEDETIIGICMDNEEAATESTNIYTCLNSANEFVLETANEILNAFTLDKIRDLNGFWYDDTSFPNNDGPEINIETFLSGDQFLNGAIRYEDTTINKIIANIVELDCSDEGIALTFDNGQTTNDGNFDYFEVDVMIASTTNNFKLGDGKITIKYNDEAFGEFVNIYDNIEVLTPDDYIAGQTVSNQRVYETIVLDNVNDVELPGFNEDYTPSDQNVFRFSFAFKQVEMVPSENVTTTPEKLCRIKLRYEDFHEEPMLEFETDSIYDNKFTTACGWVPGGSTGGVSPGDINNCNLEERTLITNDTFDSTLSLFEEELLQEITVFPNPTKNLLYIRGNTTRITSAAIYTVTGRRVLEIRDDQNEIDLSGFQSGIYFLKLGHNQSSKTFKIIKQ
ncbi:MAG: T9SS type A sorting domain-containing protein [Psychroserpens sp.]|nr:T9SS type A sorting domain-containing protein [Psychroserpens sp.]